MPGQKDGVLQSVYLVVAPGSLGQEVERGCPQLLGGRQVKRVIHTPMAVILTNVQPH